MIWDALYLHSTHIISTELPKSDETSGSIISVLFYLVDLLLYFPNYLVRHETTIFKAED